jgi:hypothetical protein
MKDKLNKLMQQFVNDFITIILSSSVKDLEEYKEAHLSPPSKCLLTPEQLSARGRKGAETRKRNKELRAQALQETAPKVAQTLPEPEIAVPSDRIMGDLPVGPSVPE